MLHHTALHALGSFPLAAGTNCEREVHRLAGWSACLTMGGQAKAKIIPTLTILLSVQSLMGFWISTRPGQGGSRPSQSGRQSHLGGQLDKFLVYRIASHHRITTLAAAKHC